MSLRVCRGCTAAYPADVPACPHCTTAPTWEDTVPKIHRDRPATDAGAADTGPAAAPATEGGDGPSPGNNSSTSPEKPETSTKKSGSGRQKPARTTGNPSSRDRAGNSTAGSTAGAGRETE